MIIRYLYIITLSTNQNPNILLKIVIFIGKYYYERGVKLTQISCDKGFIKLNTPGVCLIGFLIIIEIPNDINGLLKSMTRSRSAVIVMAATAISASY